MHIASIGQQHICSVTSSDACFFVTPFDPDTNISVPGSRFLISKYGVAQKVEFEETDVERIAMESSKALHYPSDGVNYCWTMRNQLETEGDMHVLCVPVSMTDDMTMLAIVARTKEYLSVDVRMITWLASITAQAFRSNHHHRQYFNLVKEVTNVRQELEQRECAIAECHERFERAQKYVMQLETTRDELNCEISALCEHSKKIKPLVCTRLLELSYRERIVEIFVSQLREKNVEIISTSDQAIDADVVHSFTGIAIKASIMVKERYIIVDILSLHQETIKLCMLCAPMKNLMNSLIVSILTVIDSMEQLVLQLSSAHKVSEKAISDIEAQCERVEQQALVDKANMEKCLEEANSIYAQNLEAVKAKYKSTLADKSKQATAACDLITSFVRTVQFIQTLGNEIIINPSRQGKYSLSKILKRSSDILHAGGAVMSCGMLDKIAVNMKHKVQWFVSPDTLVEPSFIPEAHALLSICSGRSVAVNAHDDTLRLPEGAVRMKCNEIPNLSCIVPFAITDDDHYAFALIQSNSEAMLRYTLQGCDCLRVAVNAIVVQYNHVVKDTLVRKHSQLKYVLAKNSLRVRNADSIQLLLPIQCYAS